MRFVPLSVARRLSFSKGHEVSEAQVPCLQTLHQKAEPPVTSAGVPAPEMCETRVQTPTLPGGFNHRIDYHCLTIDFHGMALSLHSTGLPCCKTVPKVTEEAWVLKPSYLHTRRILETLNLEVRSPPQLKKRKKKIKGKKWIKSDRHPNLQLLYPKWNWTSPKHLHCIPNLFMVLYLGRSAFILDSCIL